jgi:hypothetical protein
MASRTTSTSAKPGAKEMLLLAQANKNHPNRTLMEQQTETFKLLVKDEGGAALSKEEVEALFAMSYPALKKLNAAINANAGIQDETDGGAKNA